MQTNQNPIGIFDSGIGGTSVWKEIITLLPYENSVYLADSKNAPYGTKTKEEIIALCEKNTEFLLQKNAKIVVVACNTATTNAIKHLRSKYNVPFIGIEPAIKPAALKTKTNTIGILATKGTLSSELFDQTKEKFAKDIKVIEQEGRGLVELIEQNQLDTPEMNSLLRKYLQTMIDQKVDHLILGCTHYPYLIPQIEKMIPANVQIIDSGEAVARQTKNVLITHQLINKSNQIAKHQCFTTGSKEVLAHFTKEVGTVEVWQETSKF